MNVAEYIVKKMEELGVNDFFGVPGDYNFNILYAISNNSNTKWVGCTNELNAGYAADGYARIRGYGAVVTTYGVGELSAINAAAGSTAENIPVVYIVGVPDTVDIENSNLLHHNLQDVNYYAFMEAYKPVTASTAFLTKDNAKLEIDRVMKVLVKERKPVYIAIPNDIAQMELNYRNCTYDWISDKKTLEKAAAKIANKIAASKKPVIIGDALIKRFDALIEYKEFVTKSNIPVSNFLMGTNLIDTNHEQYIGAYFGEFKNNDVKKYIDEADLLIAVGVLYSDLNSFGRALPFNINKQIAIYGNYTYIDGNRYDNIKMSDLLEAVTNLIERKDIKAGKVNTGYEHRQPSKNNLTSEYIYPRIQEFIKSNDIVLAEIGTVPFGIVQMNVPPSVDIQLQILWSSIGWATAALLGVCVAKPKSRAILITGEGAHQVSALEIGTMLKLGLKPIVIVINNNGYTTERILCNNTSNQFNNIMQMNYSKFARIFEGDIWATRVNTEEDFDKALKVTQIMNKMCYIEVCTQPLDAPKLILDIAKKINKNYNSTADKIKDYENIEDYLDDNNDENFEYETVVHQTFDDNESEEVAQ